MPCLKAIQKTDQARHPSSPSTASRNWSPNSCKLCAVQTLQQRHSKKKGTKHRGCPHQCLSISCWAPRAANVIRHQGFPFVQGQVLIHWETTFPNSCSVDKRNTGWWGVCTWNTNPPKLPAPSWQRITEAKPPDHSQKLNYTGGPFTPLIYPASQGHSVFFKFCINQRLC